MNRPQYASVTLIAALVAISQLQTESLFYSVSLLNPHVANNIAEVTNDMSVRVFSVYNVSICASVIACGAFLTPWKQQTTCLLFILGFFGVALTFAFQTSPVVGSRFRETMEMAILLLAFRGRLTGLRAIPAIVISAAGVGWFFVVFLL